MSVQGMVSELMVQTLQEATAAIVAATTLDEVLQIIVDSLRNLIGAEYTAIVISESSGFASSIASSAADLDIVKKINDLDLPERLNQERRPLRLKNPAELFPDARSHQGELVIATLLAVPILKGGEILGVLYAFNKVGEDPFSREDEKLAEILAALVAVAIEKTRSLQAPDQYSSQLERRNSQLAALNQATMAITGELTLDKVLQKIVESARMLADAEYAALGVPNVDGGLDTFVHVGMDENEVAEIAHLPRGLGLLGAIIREQRTIRIASVADDPRSVGFPPGHPPMGSFMGVPVMASGQVLGNLYLTNKRGESEFSADDQELVEMLAAHAAVVIQNSRLYEQVGRLAIIAERARIGMDLHDGVIQSIYAVGLTLESARLSLVENAQEADHLLGSAIVGLNDTIRDIRNFILDLRPHRFSGDLLQGLSRLVREFQANTMVPVSLTMSLDEKSTVPAAVARAIFLTTQEALANIARHARASRVVVGATCEDGTIELSVVDDGRGFDARSQVQTVGHGLSNMRARAETLSGTFSLRSAPGKGTEIRLQIPCEKP